MIHTEENKTVIWFNDITSLATANVSNINNRSWQQIREYCAEAEIRWLGVSGGIPAVRNIVELKGWPEGTKHGKESIGELKAPKLPYFRRKRIRSDQGHALDIHRVFSGDLAHAWESSKKERSNTLAVRGHINIIVDIGSNRNVSNDQFFWRGAVACLLSDAITKSGRQVRIIAVDCTKELTVRYHQHCQKVIVATVLKPFAHPIDLDRMFSCTALSGFYRYYYFKANCTIDWEVDVGLGKAIEFEIDDLAYFLDDTPCITISNIWNKSQAIKKVNELIDQLGGV